MISVVRGLLLCIAALTREPSPAALMRARRRHLRKTLRGNRLVLP